MDPNLSAHSASNFMEYGEHLYMITLFAKLWIPNYQNTSSPEVRRAYGVLCGAVGIFLNVLLCAAKLFAGILTGSIAITADAFNNLSDAGSSIITLFGFKLAGQKPDPEHPFGHGRIEYIAGLIVSLIILLMGFELGKTSVQKILHPQPVSIHLLSLGILLLSVMVKCYMAFYNRSVGKKIGSAAIEATATDSFSDCFSTGAVLVCTVLSYFTNWNIDGWAGLFVAVFILFSGYRAAKETISPLLGQPPAQELVTRIQQIILRHSEILGVHDMIVHDYGPGRMFISVHAEVPANGDVLALHDTIDNAERELAEELGCIASIHMDPIATEDELTMQTKARVEELLHTYDARLSMHDFRMVVGPTHTNVIFDVVVPYQFPKTDSEVKGELRDLICGLEGNYFAVIQVDHPFID